MDQPDVATLQKELEHFRSEKEKIRAIIGRIGGAASAKRGKAINLIFIAAILSLFIFDVLRHLYRIPLTPLPPMFSLSIGILLVSIKIVWMIHKQAKVEHFQFYVLNSIEFRLNDLSRRLSQIAGESEQDRQTRQTTP